MSPGRNAAPNSHVCLCIAGWRQRSDSATKPLRLGEAGGRCQGCMASTKPCITEMGHGRRRRWRPWHKRIAIKSGTRSDIGGRCAHRGAPRTWRRRRAATGDLGSALCPRISWWRRWNVVLGGIEQRASSAFRFGSLNAFTHVLVVRLVKSSRSFDAFTHMPVVWLCQRTSTVRSTSGRFGCATVRDGGRL